MIRNEVITVIEEYINHICKEGSFDMEDEIEFRELLDSFLLSKLIKEKYPLIDNIKDGYHTPFASGFHNPKTNLLSG